MPGKLADELGARAGRRSLSSLTGEAPTRRAAKSGPGLARPGSGGRGRRLPRARPLQRAARALCPLCV